MLRIHRRHSKSFLRRIARRCHSYAIDIHWRNLLQLYSMHTFQRWRCTDHYFHTSHCRSDQNIDRRRKLRKCHWKLICDWHYTTQLLCSRCMWQHLLCKGCYSRTCHCLKNLSDRKIGCLHIERKFHSAIAYILHYTSRRLYSRHKSPPDLYKDCCCRRHLCSDPKIEREHSSHMSRHGDTIDNSLNNSQLAWRTHMLQRLLSRLTRCCGMCLQRPLLRSTIYCSDTGHKMRLSCSFEIRAHMTVLSLPKHRLPHSAYMARIHTSR